MRPIRILLYELVTDRLTDTVFLTHKVEEFASDFLVRLTKTHLFSSLMRYFLSAWQQLGSYGRLRYETSPQWSCKYNFPVKIWQEIRPKSDNRAPIRTMNIPEYCFPHQVRSQWPHRGASSPYRRMLSLVSLIPINVRMIAYLYVCLRTSYSGVGDASPHTATRQSSAFIERLAY